MAQLEYGDYYKFVVSCGIGLTVVSVGLPWLFLHEPFDLLLESSKLNALTPLARDVLAHRQKIVAVILTLIPFASTGFAISGIGMSAYGLFQWRKRQAVRDEGEEIAFKKSKLELEQMTPAEVAQKARLEAAFQEVQSVPMADDIERSITVSANDYLQTERILLAALAAQLPGGYKLLSNQKSSSFEFDGVIRPANAEAPQYFIEIKRSLRGGGSHLAFTLKKISQAVAWVGFGSKVAHIPMVIAVLNEISPKLMEDASELVRTTSDNPTALGRSLIRFITPLRLETLSAKDVQAILDVSQRLLVLSNPAPSETLVFE